MCMEDANHSLEKENILQNIDILKNVMEKTQKYFAVAIPGKAEPIWHWRCRIKSGAIRITSCA